MCIDLIQKVWETVSSGVVGNAVYDGLKAIMGSNIFNKLESHKDDKQKFEDTLETVFEANPELRNKVREIFQPGMVETVVQIQTGNINAGGNVNIGNIKMDKLR